MAWSYSESCGQRIDVVLVQGTGLDQGQRPLHGCFGAFPGWTERRGFGAATQARAIAGTFRDRGDWKIGIVEQALGALDPQR